MPLEYHETRLVQSRHLGHFTLQYRDAPHLKIFSLPYLRLLPGGAFVRVSPADRLHEVTYGCVRECCCCRYRQAELQNGRWAMLGVAGILVQEIVKPGVFFYNAGLPENLPNINFGGPDGKVTLLALQASQGF